MTNEEALRQIKQSYPAYKEYSAIDWAIKALENETKLLDRVKKLEALCKRKNKDLAEAHDHEAKLEGALKQSVTDSDKCGCDIWCGKVFESCPYSDKERLKHCVECGMKYYKGIVGLEDV